MRVIFCVFGFGSFFAVVIFLEKRDQRRKKKNDAHNGEDQTNQHFKPQRVNHPTDEEHRSAEQAHWHWQRESEKGKDRVSLATFWVTCVAIFVASLAFWQTWRQANITKGQLDEMRADQRPWVYVKEPNGDLIAKGGSISVDEKGLTIGVPIVLSNTGHAPALTVRVKIDIVPFVGDEQLDADQKRICGKRSSDSLTLPVYPGESIPAAIYTVSISKNDLNKYSLPSLDNYFRAFAIVGCIKYRSDLLKEEGETGFVLSVEMSIDRKTFLVPMDGILMPNAQWLLYTMPSRDASYAK